MFEPKIGDLVWIWPMGYTEAFAGLIVGERRIRDREAREEELAEIARNPLLHRHLCRLEYQVELLLLYLSIKFSFLFHRAAIATLRRRYRAGNLL